jgi:hypothetical protein
MDRRSNTVVLHVAEMLDLGHAHAIIRQILSAPADASIVIEFGSLAQCRLTALSLLAEAIGRRGGPVSVRGLARHDIRILRYLGISLPTPGEQGPSDEA